MSDWDSEGNISKHRQKKHRRRESSLDSFKECKKKHKSHKRRSSDKHYDPKRRKLKEESRDCVRLKSEPKDRQEKSFPKTEPKEKDGRLHLPSGSKREAKVKINNKDEGSVTWGESAKKKEKHFKKLTQVEKPNFGLSGKLAEDTNIFNGVVVKYSEPPEARMPKKRWRLYPFKGDQGLPTLYIHRQSAYLLGRDRKVADIPIDHPSCSKQHAALQYRLVTYQRTDGSIGKQIRLYLIDLESANGTYINNNKIEPKKYVELFEKDVIKFGYSSREYVLLHEHSKDNEESESEA